MKFILASFLAWKVWTVVFLLFAVFFVPQRLDFLGGGIDHYTRFPWFWAWANFDGEHYLAIAQHGYGNGEQAFFPLYPLLMRFLVWPFRGDLYFLQAAGILISNASFLIGLFGLWKLIKLDFKENIARFAIILLLVFPTSFYFGSVYTEGLFFALVVWSFYFARKGQWLWVGVLGALASATRFLGVFLLPVLLVEWILARRGKNVKGSKGRWVWVGLILIPLGLFSYMYYLYQTTGDALAFLHTLTWFGEQRSATPILLPQVFWRYAKIALDIPRTDPLIFTFLLELATSVAFLVLSVIAFFKMRLSYAIWLFLGYLLPTFSGSFSSLPRYVLPLFPAFILIALLLKERSLFVKLAVICILFIILGISTVMFVRGYWIA